MGGRHLNSKRGMGLGTVLLCFAKGPLLVRVRDWRQVADIGGDVSLKFFQTTFCPKFFQVLKV